ncbi:S9 family peptidase [Myxococcota bacterium]|nr:S9 family peptidase [Myxococcota bacterium]MBU1379462.1 S9 family peptidase [Myxococcota bacterium]MBU1496165.1 S9 family peptidase [Myxococcota bacterium]
MIIKIAIISIFAFVSCNCPEKKNPCGDKKNSPQKTASKPVEKAHALHKASAVSQPAKLIAKSLKSQDIFKDSRKPDDAGDAAKKPFTIGALYRIKNISSPVISPDGTKIAFVTTTYSLASGKTNPDIYYADLKDLGLHKLTTFSGPDYSPHFSKNAEYLYFLSTRKGPAQVYRISLKGGEPEKLTDVPDGVFEYALSEDNQWLVYSTSVYPSVTTDFAKHRELDAKKAASPLKAWMSDDLLYRHWTEWRTTKRTHIISHNLENGTLTDITPGNSDAPAFSLGERGFSISPDSKEVAFTAYGGEPIAEAWSTNKDIFTVSISGGKTSQVTSENKGSDSAPAYSPDGKYLAWKTQKIDGFESDKFNLIIMDRKTGKKSIVTENFDNWIYDFQWFDNGKLAFQAPEKGRYPLYIYDADKNTLTPHEGVSHCREFTATRGKILFTMSLTGKPLELYLFSDKGFNKLTTFNDSIVKKYDIRPVEEMFIPGADGKPVHTFIVKPHGFKPGKKYPLILNVHGGPQMQWSDSFRGDWQIYPAAGYIVAFPNPHGSTGYGQTYTSAISKDWNGKVHKDIMAVTDALSKMPFVDSTKMGAMGWSWGGYMMNWLLGHTKVFAAFASMMGVYDLPSFHGATEELWFPEWDIGGLPWKNHEKWLKMSPSIHAAKFSTPTLVITGERDYRVPYTQSLQLFTALRRQNIPARLIVFPNDGHWPSHVRSMPLYYLAHLEWFSKYLGGQSPSVSSSKVLLEGLKLLVE